jgi:hypothetical protein
MFWHFIICNLIVKLVEDVWLTLYTKGNLLGPYFFVLKENVFQLRVTADTNTISDLKSLRW